MKTHLTILILILLIGCNCKQGDLIVSDDFLQDLSSENNRAWGNLYLNDFSSGFDSLTYNYYINYFEKNPVSSAEGMVDIIKSSDMNLLYPQDSTFWVLLYYREDKLILADDASTDIGTVDTVFIYMDKETPPNLEDLAEQVIK